MVEAATAGAATARGGDSARRRLHEAATDLAGDGGDGGTVPELDLARRGFGEIFGYGSDGGLANSAAGLV